MTLPRIIGLHGYARSGKDTVAGFLAPYGYQRLAFADRLRECTYTLNPAVKFHDGYDRLQALVDQYGWDYIKVNCDEVRRLLQVFGTEVGRELIRDSVWVDVVLDQIEEKWGNPDARFVVTDMRFPNEVFGLRNAPFAVASDVELWKVNRPGVGPVNAHVSDAGLPDHVFDLSIENEGTLDDLQAQVHRLIYVPAPLV